MNVRKKLIRLFFRYLRYIGYRYIYVGYIGGNNFSIVII